MGQVKEAFVGGVISHDEMDDRLQRVLTALTSDELAAVLVDLPDAAADAPARDSLVLSSEGALIRRHGAWRVPRMLKVETTYGRVDLDLSQAILPGPRVDIELQLPYGGAKITVPADAVVDLDDLQADWKEPRYRAPRIRSSDGPLIRVFGHLEYGRLTVRHARR